MREDFIPFCSDNHILLINARVGNASLIAATDKHLSIDASQIKESPGGEWGSVDSSRFVKAKVTLKFDVQKVRTRQSDIIRDNALCRLRGMRRAIILRQWQCPTQAHPRWRCINCHRRCHRFVVRSVQWRLESTRVQHPFTKRPKGDVQVVDFHRTSPWLFLAVRFAWYEERREIMTADTREHPRV